uniref:CAF1B/HIR1 beta-propeller domain-containing protein n=1 Tax=Photinus pyralis TaxID=7054 RepID=A0A1Y1LVS8_PHOPY
MKCTIPEISWHNRDPVLSVDVHCVHNEFYKLASGGTDCHVLIWRLRIRENGAVDINIVSDLTRHQKSVNVVRWSPTGTYLATGDDDANIIIWNLKTDNIPMLEETNDEEVWLVTKILRGHKEDVYDLSWSPNEMKLISGSIDNTAILWDFSKGQTEYILSDHKGFVQGVTWDPKGDFIATICSDRVCRVFDSTGKHVRARLHKGSLPVTEWNEMPNQEIKYFHDDTFKSYFRRLNYSPDGNLLIVPSGCIESANGKMAKNATYVFAVADLSQPVAVIPSPKQITIAVRCCPVLFELRPDGRDTLINLPYRMIIAIATDSDVVLYDTQQVAPFAHLRRIHYTRITDLAWSSDGLLLVASSTDGFCTLITFQKEELGIQYTKEESESEDCILNVSGSGEELVNLEIESKSKEKEEIVVKKPNILEKWTIRTPKVDCGLSSTPNDHPNQTMNVETPHSKIIDTAKPKPKRIVPIRLGDCSTKKVCETGVTPSVELEDSSKTKDEATCSSTIVIDEPCDGVNKVSPKSFRGGNDKEDDSKNKSGNHNITPKKEEFYSKLLSIGYH